MSPPALPPLADDEAANHAVVSRLASQFEQESGLHLEIHDGALEILCSKYWLEQRENLPTQQAFEKLVRAPLLARMQAGELQAGTRVEVIRNIAEIDFRVLDEGQA
jgi:hypothetical protein